jgi:hypothetical protein
MARDGEHFFSHLELFFEKALFSSFAHFFIQSLNDWEFSFLSSLCILFMSPLSDV